VPDDKYYEDRVLRIGELLVADGPPVLEGFTFVGCHIQGPAVLLLQGNSVLTNNTFDAPSLDALFWEIPPKRPAVVGAVLALNCHFERCRMEGIGFAGPAELRALFESSS
jgi:hypothetical protein